ncbi:MAG: hypothetical protein AAF039_01145 [Bacteroidota bacterium]
MKRLFHKTLSSLLALLVLMSTVSWTVDKHLCMGRVMDVAFFHDADSCGMGNAMTAMGEKMEGKHCCDDESFTVEGQDDLKISWDELDVPSQVFLSAFVQSYFHLGPVSSGDEVQRDTYPPPLLVHDLILLHEVLLI